MKFLSPDNDGVIISCGLLLPAEQAGPAIALAKIIAQKAKLKYILNPATRPPYIKLYETVFPQKNIAKAVETIKKISRKMIPLPLDWGEIEVTRDKVILWGESNEPLDLLHQAVLLELNPLREGYYKQKYANQKFFSPEEQNSFRQWGSPWAQNYLPHLVLAKAKDKFQLFNLDLEWDFRHCLFSQLFIGIKTVADEFKPHYIFDLQAPRLKP